MATKLQVVLEKSNTQALVKELLGPPRFQSEPLVWISRTPRLFVMLAHLVEEMQMI